MALTKAAALVLLVLGTALSSLTAAPILSRFAEGITHGFLLLRSLDGTLLATGDLLQTAVDGEVVKRIVFRFGDGSSFDESVTFTQQDVLAIRSYRLSQRGPAFDEDTEIALEGSGKYRVKTTALRAGARRFSKELSICRTTSTTE